MSKPVMLITGAAGFIGNAACKHYHDRFHVIGVDDMSRETAKEPQDIEFHKRSAHSFWPKAHVDVVLHLAAQVSVTASLAYPINDLDRNAGLSLMMALGAKQFHVKCFIYSSTNKVFGELSSNFYGYPIEDDLPLNPQTPYGISKAAAGLYIRDLLPDCSYDFRQSCIYGEEQQGTEDQGWVGYLRRSIVEGRPIVCYGDGTQVRDLLHINDLLNVYDHAIERSLQPGSYIVGGGPRNAYSFSEVVKMLGGEIFGYEDWRPHDQQYFVSANSGIFEQTNWRPYVQFKEWCEQTSSSRHKLQTS